MRTGHDRAAAQVIDGKPVRFSIDLLSPFMVFERVPWYPNSTWLLPLFGISIATLLLTALVWPVTAIVRRRYKAPLLLEPYALRAYRWSRFAAVLVLVGVAVMLRNLKAVWLGQRRWPARLWSVVLVISAGAVLWVALACHLVFAPSNATLLVVLFDFSALDRFPVIWRRCIVIFANFYLLPLARAVAESIPSGSTLVACRTAATHLMRNWISEVCRSRYSLITAAYHRPQASGPA